MYWLKKQVYDLQNKEKRNLKKNTRSSLPGTSRVSGDVRVQSCLAVVEELSSKNRGESATGTRRNRNQSKF